VLVVELGDKKRWGFGVRTISSGQNKEALIEIEYCCRCFVRLITLRNRERESVWLMAEGIF